MQIHELKSIKKRVQRIGRSGKRGSYSGRGVKGQKSRSGRRLRPAERDLIMRIPKRRGFANLIKSDKAIALNLGDINEGLKKHKLDKGPLEITKDVLKAAGLLRKGYRGEVKVLSNGEIALAINTKGMKVSEGAKLKIEKAGGTVN
jgi:large subunit ribosomal protein L15